jgi:hypothetical protein
MALHRLANLSDDVSELMDEADEVLWREAGLIKKLCFLIGATFWKFFYFKAFAH